jgi:hypothetical protein
MDMAHYFGLFRNNKNLNVLNCSPIIVDMFNNLANEIFFEVNRNLYPMYYSFTFEIYFPWSCFVKLFMHLKMKKCVFLAIKQKVVQKDVERCFVILQSQFAIFKT